MTHDTCHWPDCHTKLERNGVFCSEHHFRISQKDSQSLLRLSIKASRLEDDDLKSHLRAQIAGYANVAIRKATQSTERMEDKSV